jgi:hypothetical protein
VIAGRDRGIAGRDAPAGHLRYNAGWRMTVVTTWRRELA